MLFSLAKLLQVIVEEYSITFRKTILSFEPEYEL